MISVRHNWLPLSEHIGLAREVARQSIVLLKNEDKLLPLKKDIRTLAVIGPNADNGYNMLGRRYSPSSRRFCGDCSGGHPAKSL